MSTFPDTTAAVFDQGTACSDISRSVGDDPVGSAARFDTFLLLGYHRPWGRKVADDAVHSLLSPAAADTVQRSAHMRAFAVRPLTDRPRRVEDVTAQVGHVGHRAQLAALPRLPDAQTISRVAAGEPVGAPSHEPVIGVCTNGKRDRCCAIRGRPVANALHKEFGGVVTEISHLGGHRFAATALVLPWGYAYGFVDAAVASRVVRSALDGLIHPESLRGRADLTPAQQAADVFWRTEIGPSAIDDVVITDTETDDGGALIEAQVQGTHAAVRVERVEGPTINASACSEKPMATGRWVVTAA